MMTAIRKGDLVAIVSKQTTYSASYEQTERTSVELAICVSATRDGVVKAVANLYRDGDGYVRVQGGSCKLYPWQRCLLVGSVDADALLSAYVARRWHDGDTGSMPKPFDSLDECRAFVTPFRETVEV